MMKGTRTYAQLLLPLAFLLFLVELMLLPLVVSQTYATRNPSPEHILTFGNDESLTWDKDTEVGSDGVAVTRLEDSLSEAVSEDDLLAPGMDKDSIIRLKNENAHAIRFYALAYQVRSDPSIPTEVGLEGEGLTDVPSGSIPFDKPGAEVFREVTGVVEPGSVQDFELDWTWVFHESNPDDRRDTGYGTEAASEELTATVGFYVGVEFVDPLDTQSTGGGQQAGSGNSDSSAASAPQGLITPALPQTGDASGLVGYLALMAVSALAVLLLAIRRRNEKREEARHASSEA